MQHSFLLVGSEVEAPRDCGVQHFRQQTGYTCGAASLSMITGLTEQECAALAHTTRSGTYDTDACAALNAAGFRAHYIRLDLPLDSHLTELVAQSMRWPLYLSLEFRHEGRDCLNRKRGWKRHHACVLADGRFLDPGEFHELDPEAIGHLHQRGVWVNSYIIVEK